MSELEKAQETVKWLDLFDMMRAQAHMGSHNQQSFNSCLKNQILALKREANRIIKKELEDVHVD